MSQAAGVQWQSSNLTRSQSRKIGCYWDAFVEYTAPPGIRFTWSEWGMPEHLKHWCREHGFIQKSAPSQWTTARKLWMHLIERTEPREEIGGRVVGQEQLPCNADERDRESRVVGESRSRDDTPGQQATLAVGTTDTVNSDLVEANLVKGPSQVGETSVDATQATLTESVGSGEDWAGPTANASTRLERTSHAHVYDRQRPLIVGPVVEGGIQHFTYPFSSP